MGTPTVITEPVPKEIGSDFINVRYKIISDNGSMPTEMGVCYSTNPNPTINGTKSVFTDGLGAYGTKLGNLQDGTTYYIRAYAINEYGVGYGEEIVVTTSTRLFENGYEYVDLGLSVKWATCNLGAEQPWEYGDSYAWGEVTTKSSYTQDNYKYGNGSKVTKYCKNYSNGYQNFTDGKNMLEIIDDAAYQTKGNAWRIPTYAEIQELISSCTWTYTTLNGRKGYKVTSNKLGFTNNSIFLPGCGIKGQAASTAGYYWSNENQLGNTDATLARCLHFTQSVVETNNYKRHYGLNIRPVHP